MFITLITPSYYTLAQQDTLTIVDKNYNLLIAAYSGNIDSLLYWLNQGADPNSISSDGICALNYAIQSGNFLVVKALVLNGADVNMTTSNSIPPLFMAIAYNQPATVKLLLDKGAKIDHVIKNKITALHYAIRYADSSIVSILLENGANPIEVDDDGNTVMMGIVYYKRYDLLPFFDGNETLIKFPDRKGITPFLLAVQIADTAMASYLLKIGANINDLSYNGYGILEFALISKSPVMLDWALKKNDYIKHSGNNMVRLAYFMDNKKQAKILRQNGFKAYVGPVIQCLHFSNFFSFNNRDMLWGLALGLFESHYGFNLGFNYQTRLWYNRVLINYVNDIYYQFWERRSMLGIYLQKRALLKSGLKRKLFLNFGGIAYFTYGKYRGVNQRPSSYSILTPSIEFVLKGQYFTWAFASEYFKFKDLNAYPIHFKISTLFDIPLKSMYIPIKKINWQ